MKANGIFVACCSIAAVSLSACSGDSQPTGPETEGTGLQRGYAMYADPYGESYMGEYGSETGSSTGSPTGSPTGSGGTSSDVSSDPYTQPGGSTGGSSSGSVVQRPIEQFLKSQGTFCAPDGMSGCASYMSPTANYLAWSNNAGSMTAAVDYAGIANNWWMQNGGWLGSEYRGTVTETALADGRARVVVQLNGDNVSSYVMQGAGFDGATMMGVEPGTSEYRPAEQVLGHLNMEIVYIASSMGQPIPDLMQLVRAPMGGQKLESVRMTFDGAGYVSSTGERRSVRIVYDGSMGPIQHSNPWSPEKTGPTGTSRIQMY